MKAGNGVWKALFGILSGIVVTGVSAWLLFAHNTVSRADMVEYVAGVRSEVFAAISRNATAISDLKASVEKLLESQTQLLVEQRVLITKFESYVRGHREKQE